MRKKKEILLPTYVYFTIFSAGTRNRLLLSSSPPTFKLKTYVFCVHYPPLLSLSTLPLPSTVCCSFKMPVAPLSLYLSVCLSIAKRERKERVGDAHST